MKSFSRVLLFWAILLGIATPCLSQELFGTGANWRYFKGIVSPSPEDATAWRSLEFDDTSWPTGLATFYYGDPFTGTLLDDMYGRYTTVFLRKHFNVLNPGDIQSLTLRAACDDGFICWINGQMATRFNVPEGEISLEGLASGPVSPDPAIYNDYPIANPGTLLHPGANLIAIQLLNTSLTSSDIVWDASLSFTIDMDAPVLSSVLPVSGASIQQLFAVEVVFSEPVTGVDAADLLINGEGATNVTEVTPGQFVFSFPKAKAGNVTVAFRGDHAIFDKAASPHPFQGGSWSYTVDPSLVLPGLIISEFMANNNGVIRDEDGEKSDWIELFNASGQSISLFGWSLTDDAFDLRKWAFPAKNLAAGARLVIFASGKDRTNVAAQLHTNFKLNEDGEFLALINPAGEVESGFGPIFPKQKKDFSYGRANGAPNVLGFFAKPTPGAANVTGGPGFAPDVRFSRNGGTYTTNFNLSLSLKEEMGGAVIRYTTNGTLPAETSLQYTTPILIGASVQVRARAFAPGGLPGDPHSEMYLKLEGTTPTFSSDLPVLVLHNFGKGRPPAEGQQDAYLQVYEPVDGVTSLGRAPVLSARVGIGARGSSTLGNAKVNMNLELRDEFGADDKRSLLGLPADSDWVLYGPDNFEPVLIHNPFIHQLSRDIGRYSSRTRFVEVFLVTDRLNGTVRYPTTYYGVYVLEERVRRGKDRVDIDKLEPENLTPPSVTGGYILKVDRTGPGEGGFYAANQGMVFVEPSETEITQPARSPQMQYLRTYFDAFGNALYGTNWKDPTSGYRAYIDVEAWVDHHLLNVLAFNADALRLSTFFYKPRNGRIAFGPLWDFDRALGSTDGRDANPKVWTDVNGTDYFNETSQSWWGRLFTDADFYQQWIDRYQYLRASHFAVTNLYRLVDQFANEVRKAQPREQSKWGITPRGGSYQAEVNSMRFWLSNRVTFMDSQFVRRPIPSLPSGRFVDSTAVTLSGPAIGTVYYTLDGTDPRLPGGTARPSALIAGTNPIVINANTRLIARVNNNAFTAKTGALNPPLISKWSGLTDVTYFNVTPPLLLTEIMYHPESPSLDSINSASDYEFVELKNTSSSSLNLVGFQISGGIQFTFSSTGSVTSLPAGGRVVVVKNRTAFSSRYPGLTGIAGQFSGSLGNGSNRVIVTGPLREPISDVTYNDSWAPLSDGFGFSLTLRDESVSPGLLGSADRWRASAAEGGSPGSADSNPAVVSPVLVNELLTHTDPPLFDTVELWNPGNQPADISGWWLTDDYRQPKKYRLPQGSIVAANGYMLIDETLLRVGPTGFSLSALGDSVHLFSADTLGNLTGWHHGFSFSAAFNGVSFGRYVTSDAVEHFVPVLDLTLGQTNALPRVGPLAITEIHFNPSPKGTNNNTLDEFVEVRNISTNLLPLWDPLHETNAWHLRGGVDFDFPFGAVLPSGGFALVVGFDPAFEGTTGTAFRSKFQVPAGVPLFGPWTGTLNNSGESLELKRPDEPVDLPASNAGEVPYVSVEQIHYLPTAPWPEGASGTGKSLQRQHSQVFGDEPLQWVAADPTAGRLNAGDDLLSTQLDSDNDGLPDVWEIQFGLDPHSANANSGPAGDPDNDGHQNWQEYIAGTDPTNPEPDFILGAAFDATGVVLSVAAQPGRSYTFWYRDSLDGSSWQVLTHFFTQYRAGTLTTRSDNGPLPRFYRVSVELP